MNFALSSFHQKKRDFFRCENCSFFYVDPITQLTVAEESERYRFHENDNNDISYRNYLSEMLSPVKLYFQDSNSSLFHLDFGSGKSTTCEHILKEWSLTSNKSYSYDLYFSPEHRPDVHAPGNTVFDLITAIEVVEHFREPKKSWMEIIKLLKTGGFLYVVTHILNKNIDVKTFSNWWYKNDPTHVSIYTMEALSVLAREFGLELVASDKKKYFLWRKK